MSLQVVAILEAGHPLPFKVRRADVDLPELQVGAIIKSSRLLLLPEESYTM